MVRSLFFLEAFIEQLNILHVDSLITIINTKILLSDLLNNRCIVFAGKAAQQVNIPVPEGCTDRNAKNYDPTARSDDGTCLYTVE